jgi:hypothetical protein
VLSVVVCGEERFVVGGGSDAGGSELGARVPDRVCGELGAGRFADRVAGTSALDGALRYAGAGCHLCDWKSAEYGRGELGERVVLGVGVFGEDVVEAGHEARDGFLDSVGFLPDVVDRGNLDGRAGQPADRSAVARLAVRAEALGLGMTAKVVQRVAVGFDSHLIRLQ